MTRIWCEVTGSQENSRRLFASPEMPQDTKPADLVVAMSQSAIVGTIFGEVSTGPIVIPNDGEESESVDGVIVSIDERYPGGTIVEFLLHVVLKQAQLVLTPKSS